MGWSPEYSRHYYVNATLGVSQWEPPPQQQSPATRSQKLPPIGISSLSKGKLKPANVEAAMREREAMRTAESRQRALQQQEDYQLALGLSRSRAEQQERPGEAAAAAAAAALRRAQSADGIRGHPGSSRSPGHMQPLPPLQHGVASKVASRVSSAPRTHTAAFNATVEERFNAWSTSMYASNSFLHELGATARQEQRERIREALEVEWRAAGLPVFEGEGRGAGSAKDKSLEELEDELRALRAERAELQQPPSSSGPTLADRQSMQEWRVRVAGGPVTGLQKPRQSSSWRAWGTEALDRTARLLSSSNNPLSQVLRESQAELARLERRYAPNSPP